MLLVRLTLTLEELKKQIKTLENENNELKTKIENLERGQKNYLMIFGLKTANTENVCHFVRRKIKDLLYIELKEQDVKNIFFQQVRTSTR